MEELRRKETEIQEDLHAGIDYAAGRVTVIELLERHISLKQGVRYDTKVGYNFVLNLVKQEDFGQRKISGCRYIPMTDDVYQSLQRILKNRPKVQTEMMVDGYGGFILLDKNHRPKVALHIENEMRWGMKKYKKLNPDKPLPHITPHVFRHTFCTNLANSGMDVKRLQYLMGHSDAGVTMNVYTHASFAQAEQSMQKILRFDPKQEAKTG